MMVMWSGVTVNVDSDDFEGDTTDNDVGGYVDAIISNQFMTCQAWSSCRGLSSLLGSAIGVEEFRQSFFEQRPLHIQRAGSLCNGNIPTFRV